MSGFTGIIHLDGAPADPELLEKMTRLAERHGGDAYNTWCESNVGFGHSLLKTSPESVHEQQPYSFDRNIWIVGDVRVDEREQLVSALLDKGRQASLSQPDIELVLHAFHAWGEQCIEHFYGDFAVLFNHIPDYGA
jgi:asparagine synthase (glutamine-hydrolysing)